MGGDGRALPAILLLLVDLGWLINASNDHYDATDGLCRRFLCVPAVVFAMKYQSFQIFADVWGEGAWGNADIIIQTSCFYDFVYMSREGGDAHELKPASFAYTRRLMAILYVNVCVE